MNLGVLKEKLPIYKPTLHFMYWEFKRESCEASSELYILTILQLKTVMNEL